LELLTTDLNAGSSTAQVVARYCKSCFIISGVWWPVCHSPSVRRVAEQEIWFRHRLVQDISLP